MFRLQRFLVPAILAAVTAMPRTASAQPDLSLDSLFVCAISDSEVLIHCKFSYAVTGLSDVATSVLTHFPCTVRDTQFVTYHTPPAPDCTPIVPPGCPQGSCPEWTMTIKKNIDEPPPPPEQVQPVCSRTPPPQPPACVCKYEREITKPAHWPSPHENTYVIVTIDPENLIPEADEQNNSRSVVVTPTLQFCSTVGVDVAGRLAATGLRLGPSAPNPTRTTAEFVFQTSRRGVYEISILDTHGRRVRVLQRGPFDPGEHRIHWDGKDAHGFAARPGAYFYAVRGAGGEVARKLVVIP